MSEAHSGNYPIERRSAEIERLRKQAEAMAPETLAMLDRFGPMQGWACLDISCGPGGITDLLSAYVGLTGRVVGLDMDAKFLRYARVNALENVEFRESDACTSNLLSFAFDLVHMRFVASTAGNPERLLKESVRLARPGGIVALQEPEGSTLTCYPPHPAWDRLKSALLKAFVVGVGARPMRRSAVTSQKRRLLGQDEFSKFFLLAGLMELLDKELGICEAFAAFPK